MHLGGDGRSFEGQEDSEHMWAAAAPTRSLGLRERSSASSRAARPKWVNSAATTSGLAVRQRCLVDRLAQARGAPSTSAGAAAEAPRRRGCHAASGRSPGCRCRSPTGARRRSSAPHSVRPQPSGRPNAVRGARPALPAAAAARLHLLGRRGLAGQEVGPDLRREEAVGVLASLPGAKARSPSTCGSSRTPRRRADRCDPHLSLFLDR